MKLKIARERVNGVTVLNLHGELIAGEESRALRKVFKDLTAEGERKLLLNLEGVTHIDTSGLGILVGGYSDMNGHQGAIKLLSLTERIHTLLKITRLITIFDVYASREEAIKSFQ
jgi:anti-sigma B factor antagonist